MEFQKFLIESEANDIQKTLKKLPTSHQYLVQDYQISFESGASLKGDKKHVGLIDEEKKKIVIASSWHYPNEYVLLHEIGHLIWGKLMTTIQKKNWEKLIKSTKSDQISKIENQGKKPTAIKQNPEELFCMSYSQFYCNNPLMRFDNKEWQNFIKNLS